MIFKSRIFLAGACSLLLLSACHSANGPVAAKVNGIPISKDRVDMVAKQRMSQGQPDTAESRKEIIDRLTLQTLVSEEALKKGMDKTPEVSSQLEMARRSILASAFVEDYIKNNPVTDDMLHAEYEKFKATAGGNEYKARHILVDKEADAKEIIAKLKKDPKVFEALAKEKSKDPGSKDNGGELGWFDPRSMVPEFGAALAKLEKGKLTEEPVKSQFGYHVIQLEDSRAKEPPPFEQVKPSLTRDLQQQNLKKVLDEMKAKAKVEIMPDAMPAPTPPTPPGPPKEYKPAESAAPAPASSPAPAAPPAPAKK